MRNPWLDIPPPDYEGHMASPHPSLASLASIMRLVSPEELRSAAALQGFRQIGWQTARAGGKRFQVQTFRRDGPA
jgi:hypothetical protein